MGPSTAHLANKSLTNTQDHAILSQHRVIYGTQIYLYKQKYIEYSYICIMSSSHILPPFLKPCLPEKDKKTPPLLSSKGTPGNHITGTPRSLEVPPQISFKTNRSLQCHAMRNTQPTNMICRICVKEDSGLISTKKNLHAKLIKTLVPKVTSWSHHMTCSHCMMRQPRCRISSAEIQVSWARHADIAFEHPGLYSWRWVSL